MVFNFFSDAKTPGSATAAFMTLNGMESLLSHQYFQTEKKTEMCSDVITAVIPVNNTNLTEPVNFTIYHRKVQLQNLDSTSINTEGYRLLMFLAHVHFVFSGNTRNRNSQLCLLENHRNCRRKVYELVRGRLLDCIL